MCISLDYFIVHFQNEREDAPLLAQDGLREEAPFLILLHPRGTRHGTILGERNETQHKVGLSLENTARQLTSISKPLSEAENKNTFWGLWAKKTIILI